MTSPRGLAESFLQEALLNGAVREKAELLEAAAAEGISPRTLERVAADLGVVHTRHGFGGGMSWSLPVRGPAPSPLSEAETADRPQTRHSVRPSQNLTLSESEKSGETVAKRSDRTVTVQALRIGQYPADGGLRKPGEVFDYEMGPRETLLPSWMRDVAGRIPSRHAAQLDSIGIPVNEPAAPLFKPVDVHQADDGPGLRSEYGSRSEYEP